VRKERRKKKRDGRLVRWLGRRGEVDSFIPRSASLPLFLAFCSFSHPIARKKTRERAGKRSADGKETKETERDGQSVKGKERKREEGNFDVRMERKGFSSVFFPSFFPTFPLSRAFLCFISVCLPLQAAVSIFLLFSPTFSFLRSLPFPLSA